MDSISWETFVGGLKNLKPADNLEPTNIECPQCKALLFRRTDIVLTSNPPKSKYVCKRCGWTGSA